MYNVYSLDHVFKAVMSCAGVQMPVDMRAGAEMEGGEV